MRLEGKRALVTGAGSGIGRASAILFAAEGAQVLAVDLSEGVEATATEIAKAGGRCLARRADAADEAAVKLLVETCVLELGGLEVVFANAGIGGGLVPFFEQQASDWQSVLRVNLIGPFLAIKYGAAHMREHGGGSIICTASVAGLRSGAGGSPYSASKAGVISLVQTSANQLTGTGVRVNAICPGLIETGMTKPMFDLARARQREEDRPAESAEAPGPADRDRPDGPLSRQRRRELRERAGHRRRWRSLLQSPLRSGAVGLADASPALRVTLRAPHSLE